MSAGLMTTVLATAAVLWTSVPVTVASAAEVLARAAAARESFAGWYTFEVYDPETDAWQTEQRVNPAAGKRFVRLAADPEEYARGLHESAWLYMDAQAPLTVSYDATTRTATVTGTLTDQYASTEMPLSEAGLREWIELEDRYDASTVAEGSGGIRLVLDKRPAAADADERWVEEHGYYPQQIVAGFGADDGLLRTLSVKQEADDALTPYARLTYHTQAIEDWRDLIDETMTVKDLRPDAATRELLEAIDAVWKGGLGFETAVVVKRTGHPIRGTLNEGGSVTLYAEREGASGKYTWRQGQDIAGWPEPTLKAVLEHAERVAPDVVVVSDGTTAWWRWGAEEPWQTRAVASGLVDGVLNGARLVGQLWPSRAEIFDDSSNTGVRPTTRRDPQRSNGVILEAVGMTRWASRPEELIPGTKREVLFLEDLGPLPLEHTFERYGEDGELWSRETVATSLGDLVMYRKPVRVPLYWRLTRESPRQETLPEFYHLLPQPGVVLEAEWFGDPRQRWGGEVK